MNKKIVMKAKDVLIRDEKNTDYKAIPDVTKLAFETMEISNLLISNYNSS